MITAKEATKLYEESRSDSKRILDGIYSTIRFMAMHGAHEYKLGPTCMYSRSTYDEVVKDLKANGFDVYGGYHAESTTIHWQPESDDYYLKD